MIPSPATTGPGWPWRPDAPPPPPRDATLLPRITVVVPSFEQGAFLESAIRSVLLQGYPNLELFVVDGGSRDQSTELIERYRPHLGWASSEHDRGQAHAINKGFARATGNVFGWLNADDILLPGSLLAIGRAFAARPYLDAVAGLRRQIRADGSFGGRVFWDRPLPNHLRRYCCLAQETVYISRRVPERLGGLDEARGFALDYEYWLRMVEHGFRFTVLPAYLGGMRDHPATKRATRDAERQSDLRVLAARYGLGTNEEDAWLRGGSDHTVRLALLEDLCRSWIAPRPRLVTAALRLLDQPAVAATAISLYRRYRLRRPRGSGSSRAAAAIGTLLDAGLNSSLGVAEEPSAPGASPIVQSRLNAADVAQLTHDGTTAPDTLALGGGWSWPEQTRAGTYRWAESGAEVLILRPSGTRRHLRIELEAGPSLGGRSSAVELHDESGRAIARSRIESDDAWLATLPLARGPAARRYRIVIPEAGGRPASTEDPRVLDFRATSLAWQGEPGAEESRPNRITVISV